MTQHLDADASSLGLVLHATQALASALVALLLFALLRVYRREFLRHWALAWSAQAVFHLTQGVVSELAAFPTTHPVRVALASLALSMGYAQVVALLSGTWLLLKGRLHGRFLPWLVLLPFALGGVSALVVLGSGPSLRAFSSLSLPGLLTGLAFVTAAAGVARFARQEAGPARWMVVVLFALAGSLDLQQALARLPRLEGGFLLSLASLIVPHFLALLFELFLMWALLLWFFEDERRALLESARALRASEEQRRRAEHMEAVGRLAGGLAHDFNNLLTAIRGHAELLTGRAGADDAAREDLQAITHATRRAAELVRELLTFSRRQPVRPRHFSLDALLLGMRTMLARLLGESVRLELEPGASGALVHADPGQIELAVINLASNARDAIADSGTLSLSTSVVSIGAGNTSLPEGLYLRLDVADSGCGIRPDQLPKIFEPYYTTKPGKGTGLGLASVHGIVKQSGGEIEVVSAPGEGTLFHIWLPLAEAPAERIKELAPRLAARGGSERILLVEDDEAVRRSTQRLLARAGYRVELVADADEACARLSASGEPFELVLTDVVMPGRPLAAFLDELRLERPELRVLLMSGYSEATIHLRGIELAQQNFLAKPFSSDDLLAAVRHALDEPEASGLAAGRR